MRAVTSVGGWRWLKAVGGGSSGQMTNQYLTNREASDVFVFVFMIFKSNLLLGDERVVGHRGLLGNR
jgi:hypothetical protein